MLKYETNEQYHRDDGYMSSSKLKALLEPRVFEALHITRTMQFKQSDVLKLGTAVHTLALEPDRFGTEFAISPFKDRRTKQYKQWAADQSAPLFLTTAEGDTVKRCVDSLRANPYVGPALEAPGDVELSHRWVESVHGVACKTRPDKVCHAVLLDIKTTAVAIERRKFAQQAFDFGYDIQQSHYLDGMKHKHGLDFVFVFGVIETTEPFRCRAYRLDAEAAEIGDQRRDWLLSEYVRRKESGDWSEHGENELLELSLPDWSIKRWLTREQ